MNADPLDVLVAERGTRYPITAAIHAWKHNGGIYEEEAVLRVQEAMRHDLLTDHRSHSEGRMRPSSLSNPCGRFHALQFSGFEPIPFSEISTGYMDAGTWAHYQWQCMLLSAYLQGFGGITDIEVPVVYNPWRLSGSMDGVQPDGSIFELKTVGSFKWSGWKSKGIVGIKEMPDPPMHYLEQFMGYLKSQGVTVGSLVCVSRDNNNDFREFRVEFDQAVFDAVDRRTLNTVADLAAGRLPEMQESCARVVSGDLFGDLSKAKKAEWEGIFDRCQFHHVCPKAVL